jgi:GST-like protein
MPESIELYGAQTGNSLRAAIALAEVGIAFTAKPIDLRAGAQYQPEFLAVNPAGKVPALVDHHFTPALVITQSNAIILYADEQVPGHLAPRQPGPARMRVLERFFYFVTDVIATSHAAFFLRQTGHKEPALPLDYRALEHLMFAESFLSDGFMAGDAFSMADISAFTYVASVHKRLPWDKLPQMARWFEMIEARPGVQRGMRAFED